MRQAAASRSMHTSSSSPAPAVHTIQWCYDGWGLLFDRTQARLPAGFHLRKLDPTRPLVDQVADADVLIPTTGQVTREVIEAAVRCRLITQPASGTGNICIEAATERGIPVCNAPGANSQSTAELTLLHILYIAQRIGERQAVFAARQDVGQPLAMELEGKTLGLLGITGEVGRRVARMARAVGMEVVGTSSRSTRGELEEVLRRAHVVSIHLPSNPQTRGLIGEAELRMMRPDAILVNTARADVLDRDALLRVLQDRHLKGVGLDVFWQEPADPADPLYQHPKLVLCTPHVGVASEEVYDRLSDILVENIKRVCHAGQEPLYQLNKTPATTAAPGNGAGT
jgi:phosphoglycerate dehydrogenase-like enzyme